MCLFLKQHRNNNSAVVSNRLDVIADETDITVTNSAVDNSAVAVYIEILYTQLSCKL